jgi:hypothetical protein
VTLTQLMWCITAMTAAECPQLSLMTCWLVVSRQMGTAADSFSCGAIAKGVTQRAWQAVSLMLESMRRCVTSQHTRASRCTSSTGPTR